MRNIVVALLVTLVLLHSSLGPGSAQNSVSDDDAIRHLIENSYVSGVFSARDEAAVRRGFHPSFVLVVRQADSVLVVTLDAWLERLGLNGVPSTSRYTHVVDALDITGSTAAVKLRIFREGRHIYTDYFHLYRFREGWHVVGKVFEGHDG